MSIFDWDNYKNGPSAISGNDPLTWINPYSWASTLGEKLSGNGGGSAWGNTVLGGLAAAAAAYGGYSAYGAMAGAGSGAGAGGLGSGTGPLASYGNAAGGSVAGGTNWGALGAQTFGQLGSNYLNYQSQQSANAQNREIANDQMNFQREMSSTAHQREVNDLSQAGLNPILSAGGGGSSTPSGSSATMQAPQVSMPDIMAGYMSMQNLQIQQKQLEQADAKIAIDRANSASTIAKNLTDNELTRSKKVSNDIQQEEYKARAKAAKMVNGGLKAITDIQQSLTNPQNFFQKPDPYQMSDQEIEENKYRRP